MSFIGKLLLGNGTLKPQLRAALESEGLLALEEGLPGSVRYNHFKSPGRRFHGKVTLERIGLGVSEKRLSVFCRSGRVKLIDTPFSDPRMSALEVSLPEADAIAIRIDFDRAGVPKVSGQITIKATTPKASSIVQHLQNRGIKRAPDNP